MTTPRLGAPELVQNQAVPETTVNETFYWLDAASMGGFKVIDRDLSGAPPGSPAQGDCYILAGAGSGGWAGGAAEDVALYIGTAWEIRTPDDGWEAWVVDEAVKVGFSSGSWGIIGTFSGASYLPLTGGTLSGDLIVPAEAYGSGWNGSNEAPTKNDVYDKIETIVAGIPGTPTESIILAPSDETTALTTGTAKITFRMPYAFTLTGVRASLTTTQTSGSIFTVDVNEGGSTILSTKLTIDNGEKTSTTAATAAVISDTALADDAEITVDIDQIGDGTAKGLKVVLIGHQ